MGREERQGWFSGLAESRKASSRYSGECREKGESMDRRRASEAKNAPLVSRGARQTIFEAENEAVLRTLTAFARSSKTESSQTPTRSITPSHALIAVTTQATHSSVISPMPCSFSSNSRTFCPTSPA